MGAHIKYYKHKRGNYLMGKVWICILAALALSVAGCGITRTEGGEREAAEYTVLGVDAVPPEVEKVITQQQGREFRMTYKSGGYLYLLRGYGPQESGGFSVQVEEVSVSDTALYFRTRLLGPAEEEQKKGESSEPWLVVKTEDPGVPVIFE